MKTVRTLNMQYRAAVKREADSAQRLDRAEKALQRAQTNREVARKHTDHVRFEVEIHGFKITDEQEVIA